MRSSSSPFILGAPRPAAPSRRPRWLPLLPALVLAFSAIAPATALAEDPVFSVGPDGTFTITFGGTPTAGSSLPEIQSDIKATYYKKSNKYGDCMMVFSYKPVPSGRLLVPVYEYIPLDSKGRTIPGVTVTGAYGSHRGLNAMIRLGETYISRDDLMFKGSTCAKVAKVRAKLVALRTYDTSGWLGEDQLMGGNLELLDSTMTNALTKNYDRAYGFRWTNGNTVPVRMRFFMLSALTRRPLESKQKWDIETVTIQPGEVYVHRYSAAERKRWQKPAAGRNTYLLARLSVDQEGLVLIEDSTAPAP